MKKKVLLFMAAVTGIMFAGCTKEDKTTSFDGSLVMTVNASVNNQTKVTTNGDITSFDAGDALSLYAWTGSADEVSFPLVVNGIVNTLNESGAWVPQSQMLWKSVRDEHFFIGVSPARKVESFTADKYVLDPAQYEVSDLLLSTELSGLKAESGSVDMVFTHAMAKLNVNLKFRSQWAETPEVTSVATTAKNNYTVNYLTKAVTATGDDAQVALSPLENAASGYALSFSGLQVPQDEVTVITVVIDGKSYTYTAAEPIDLSSGKVTTLGLIVGREKITLGSIAIDSWAEGTTYSQDGDAMESDVLGISGPVAFRDLKVGDILIEGAIINRSTFNDFLELAEGRSTLTDLGNMGWTYQLSSYPLTVGENGYLSDGYEIYKPVTEYPADYGDAWEVIQIKNEGNNRTVYLGGIKSESLKL